MIDKIIRWIRNLFKHKQQEESALEKLQQEEFNLVYRIVDNSNKDLTKLELNLLLREQNGLGSIESTNNLKKEIEQIRSDKFIRELSQKIQNSNIYTLENLRKHFKNIKLLSSYKGNLVDNDIDWIIKLKEKLKEIKYPFQPYYLFYIEDLTYEGCSDKFSYFKYKFFKDIKSTNNIIRLKHDYYKNPTYNEVLYPPRNFDYPSLIKLKGNYINNVELFIAYNDDNSEYVLFIYSFVGSYIFIFNKESEKIMGSDKTLLGNYI